MPHLLLQPLKLEAVAAAGTAGYGLGPITLIYIALLAVKFLQLHARFSWSLSRADRLIETAAVRLLGPVALARVAIRATCRLAEEDSPQLPLVLVALGLRPANPVRGFPNGLQLCPVASQHGRGRSLTNLDNSGRRYGLERHLTRTVIQDSIGRPAASQAVRSNVQARC
jgi:hypothetical protein